MNHPRPTLDANKRKILAGAALAGFFGAGLGGQVTAAEADAGGARTEFFESRIRPVLVEHCLKCHSAAAGKSKGGLKLDGIEAILKGGDSGPALVPGDPGASLILKAIRYTNDDLKMPPDGKLPDAVIADFETWVRQGAAAPGNPALDPNPSPAPAVSNSPAAPGAAPRAAPSAGSGPPKPGPVDMEAGRKWWAFQPISDPTPPLVRDGSAAPTAIDAFLQAKLEAAGLEPAPAADKRTLIRRATFDLTGLPPSPPEVEAFLRDDSPGAFEAVVDRLLASPAYGERWGRRWLDVARYTDSVDSRATPAQDVTEAWRYRDWVVRALNADMPYDQFVRLQIAGDLIATDDGRGGYNPDGLVATGLLVLGNWPGGDADKEKMVSDIVDDQIDVISRGVMGLTIACARCHDHKFDPVTTRDYYSLAGIFYSTHFMPGPGAKTEGSPILHSPLASAAELEARKARKTSIEAIGAQIAKFDVDYSTREASKRLPQIADYVTAALDAARAARGEGGGGGPAPLAGLAAARGLSPVVLGRWVDQLGLGEPGVMRRVTRGVAGLPALTSFNGKADTPSITINSSNAEQKFISITQPPRSVTMHPGPTTPVAVRWTAPRAGRFALEGGVADADGTCGEGIAWALELTSRGAGAAGAAGANGAGAAKLADGAIPNGGKAEFPAGLTFEVAAGDFVRLVILPGASHACDTTAARLRIRAADEASAGWDLAEDLIRASGAGATNPFPDSSGAPDVWAALDLGAAPNAETDPASLAGRFRLALGAAALAEKGDWTRSDLERRAAEAMGAELSRAAAADPEGKTPAGAAAKALVAPDGALNAPVAPDDPPPLPRAVRAGLVARLEALRAVPEPPLDLAIGMQEGGVPDTAYAGLRDVKVHIRGSYARLGDVVPRRAPEILTPAGPTEVGFPVNNESGRRELAEWITRPDHPLTVRVISNRIWQGHFGEGIVRTPGNFGRLGEAPSHPELLDFLASRLIESGWSLKSLHKAIMMTAAYRRSSAVDGRMMEADPDNRLLARASRRRLEAEAIRDSALAASGELDPTMGGPAFVDLATPRRTLYLKTVRSDRMTFGALFDAADPAALTDKRTEATVSGQALFMLNSPWLVDRAAKLAARATAANAGGPPERVVAWLYQTLYARPPAPAEIEIGLKALGWAGAANPSTGAPLDAYCQILLCANEFIYVD